MAAQLSERPDVSLPPYQLMISWCCGLICFTPNHLKLIDTHLAAVKGKADKLYFRSLLRRTWHHWQARRVAVSVRQIKNGAMYFLGETRVCCNATWIPSIGNKLDWSGRTESTDGTEQNRTGRSKLQRGAESLSRNEGSRAEKFNFSPRDHVWKKCGLNNAQHVFTQQIVAVWTKSELCYSIWVELETVKSNNYARLTVKSCFSRRLGWWGNRKHVRLLVLLFTAAQDVNESRVSLLSGVLERTPFPVKHDSTL